VPAASPKTLTLKVSPGLDRRLELAARRLKAPKSELMRSAIERFLDRFLDQEEPPSRSFGAEAADLAGIVEAAPDLSSGKRHLRSYGH
jgi:predicted transcriptional regulator